MPSSTASCLEFLQRLIRTPSLPGEEEALAKLVLREMTDLGFSQVRIDEVGNVIGWLKGRGEAPPLMFNTHLDHVDVGDQSAWPYPPFGGEVHDGKVWGRGAVDIKGPLAAQVHGAARAGAAGPPPGDVYVTCVVQEEIGGVGARHLAQHLSVPWIVVGEPSGNSLRRGHRGRTELVVHIRGRSAHASVPQEGVNPLTSLGRFLASLGEARLGSHPELGRSTVTPTLVRTDQTSANVVPGEVWQTCDWRNVPGESAEDARAALTEILEECLEDAAGGEVEVPVFGRRTYTGETVSIPADNPAYLLPRSHPLVVAASELLRETLGRTVGAGVWDFATDGGHFAAAGMSPIGFGPGDELLAHTIDEHVEIAALEEALEANTRLAKHLALYSVR